MLWCFAPSVITYAASITPDLSASVLGLATCYAFRSWLRNTITWHRTSAVGVTLGLCELTKFTWLILYLLFPLLLMAFLLQKSEGRCARTFATRYFHLIVMFLVSVYVINLGYGFEESFRPIGEFQFFSQQFGGSESRAGRTGNRFQNAWLAKIPVPLPANMVRGIDFIKYEFENGYWSYLNGEHRHGGWWYYYIYAMFVKIPVGTQLEPDKHCSDFRY